MSLNKANLKNDIIGIMTDMLQREQTSIEEFATRLSDVIDVYVKEADINYTGGLIAPNGAVAGTFNGTIS
ncbi:hypothetical protein PL373_19090 [Tenacibaculum maritimum]|nr:hypothetical protein [Tenacibaculum maritimum]MDB0603195.1 hypothetical protein [Tenacibaculum maritimum]MDB0610457.1 hypothetical protein [Tenacibaculum maritimum]